LPVWAAGLKALLEIARADTHQRPAAHQRGPDDLGALLGSITSQHRSGPTTPT